MRFLQESLLLLSPTVGIWIKQWRRTWIALVFPKVGLQPYIRRENPPGWTFR